MSMRRGVLKKLAGERDGKAARSTSILSTPVLLQRHMLEKMTSGQDLRTTIHFFMSASKTQLLTTLSSFFFIIEISFSLHWYSFPKQQTSPGQPAIVFTCTHAVNIEPMGRNVKGFESLGRQSVFMQFHDNGMPQPGTL